MSWWISFKLWIANKLVPQAKLSWRWFSMQMMAIAAAIQGVWTQLDDDTKANLPSKLVAYTTIGLLVLGLGGRLIKQNKPDA